MSQRGHSRCVLDEGSIGTREPHTVNEVDIAAGSGGKGKFTFDLKKSVSDFVRGGAREDEMITAL